MDQNINNSENNSTNLVTINNSDVLILDRSKELKPVKCGNRNDKLTGNRCQNGDQDPYPAQCPINYEMNLHQNKHTCFKNCIPDTDNGNVKNIHYNINLQGKQCLKKSFIS